MPPTTAEFLNALAPTWQAAVAAALLQGSLALAVVVLLWLALRKHLGNALAHGLFFLVPVKTVAAALFVAWPVVISFSITVPETVYSAIYPPQPAPVGAISESNPPAVAIEAAMPPSQEQWQALPPDFAKPGPEAAFSEPFTTNHKTVVVTEAEKPPLGTAAWAMIAWAAACLGLMAFVCIRHMRLMRRMVRNAVPPGADYQDKLNRLAAEMRLARVPQLVESPAIATPAVFGLVRPRLVVPPGFFSTFDADQQRWILLHELAHIRRRDLWWLAFERLTGIAFFFHPALWISSRATRHFRELACDDLAQMQSGLLPRQCAETFLKLIMWTSRNPARPHPITPTLSLTERYPAIQRRIINMTDLNPQSRWALPSKATFAALLATAILISLPFSPKLVAQSSKQENKNEAPPQSKSVKLKGNIPEVKPKSPLIGGTVVDETGKPLEGVKVVLSLRVKDLSVRAKQRVVRIDTGMTTDMNGKWSKADLPADIMDLMVQVDHPTIVTRNKSGNYHLPPFPNLTNGQDLLELVKGLKVTLRVQDEAGRPVANADVYDPTNTSIRTEMQPIGQTSANGVFERHNASKSTWVYVIKKPGFAPAVQIVDNDEGKSPAEIKFVMKPGRTIKGRLVDDSGEAVPNHHLAIYDRSQPIFFVYNLHAVTDANGYFECHDIPKNGAIELYRGGGDYEQLAHRIGENVVDVGTIAINALSHAVVKLVDAATGQPIPPPGSIFNMALMARKAG